MAKDELHSNYGVMTGTPTLVAGALREDTNQALQFDGSTNKMTVTDSTSSSLAVADGAPGGMALELFVKVTSTPGAIKEIANKSGSYTLQVNTARKLVWTLVNGANSIAVTSAAALTVGTWYHIVCVYNGDYTGSPIFGNQTQGTSQMNMPGDYRKGSATGHNNLYVSHESILEKGQITSVVLDLQRVPDETLDEWVAAVIYENLAGDLPGAKVAQSAPVQLSDANVVGRQWLSFPISGVVQPGACWLGFVGGSNSNSYRIGYETTGGKRGWRNAVVTSTPSYAIEGETPDPFGSATTDSGRLAIYANYTPLARTGDEGFALVYINGVLDASSAYTHGIANSANNLEFAPNAAVSIDEPSIWNKKLTPVQVSRHYAAR